MFEKLKFWKKEEEFPVPNFEHEGHPQGLDALGMPRPMPGVNEPPLEVVPPALGQPVGGQFGSAPQGFSSQQAASGYGQVLSQDQQFQLISAKLDTIKAQLETVLQRLDKLERKEEERPYQQRWKASF